LPVYEVVEITGDQHKQEFLVSCQVDSVDWVAQGKGRSRRKAEQQAAAAFIEHLEGRKA
jgi:ribonuclease-3